MLLPREGLSPEELEALDCVEKGLEAFLASLAVGRSPREAFLVGLHDYETMREAQAIARASAEECHTYQAVPEPCPHGFSVG